VISVKNRKFYPYPVYLKPRWRSPVGIG